MDCFGKSFDEEWEDLSRMFSGDQGFFSSEEHHGLSFENSSIFWPTMIESNNNASSFAINDDHESFLCASNDHHNVINPNFCHFFSQECSTPSPSNFCAMDELSNSLLEEQAFSDEAMEEIMCLKQDVVVEKGKMEISVGQPVAGGGPGSETPLKRKVEMTELPNAVDDKKPKKKTRVSRDNKIKKNVQQKKNKKVMITAIANGNDGEQLGNINNDNNDNNNNNNYYNGDNNNNNNNGGESNNAQSTSSCSSENDSDLNNGTLLNSNGKTRASRGAATDPQSLYARKRRERINERLRILQNLVPNGTKVDISTMLEEAVHYVKFMQLQIKLLSSDDLWMYAPIACNGIDMGLYQNII